MNTPNRSLAIVETQKVDELSQQLVKYLPGGVRLTANEAHAVARISLMHGLDPFTGDIYYMKRKDGTPIGIKVGIRAVRKKAMQQAAETGGSYWPTFRQLNADEMKAMLIPPGSLAFECRLFDTATISKYVESITALRSAGLTWDEIKPMIGDKPYTVGIGVFKTGEQTMMLPVQTAQKRAEEDALKRRYYLPFDVSEAEGPSDEPPDNPATPYIDGRVVDADTGEIHGDASNGKHAAAELFGPSEPIPAVEVQRTAEPVVEAVVNAAHKAGIATAPVLTGDPVIDAFAPTAPAASYPKPSGPAKPVKAGPGDKPKADAGQCEVHDVPLDWHYSKAKETWYAGHRTGNGDACWGRKQKETAAVGK